MTQSVTSLYDVTHGFANIAVHARNVWTVHDGSLAVVV